MLVPSRRLYPSIVILVLSTLWLLVNGRQCWSSFLPVLREVDWVNHLPTVMRSGAIWLTLGVIAWILILSLTYIRYPRHFLVVALGGVGAVCGTLLTASQQWLAASGVVWLGIVAWLMGLAILERLQVNLDPFSRVVMALALGLGLLAILILILGLAGVLTITWVLTGSILVALVLVWFCRRDIQRLGRDIVLAWHGLQPLPWLAFVCLVLFSIFFVINWIGALAPEVMFDALMYHLLLAKTYAAGHQVTGLPYFCQSYWPMNGEMLFTVGYLLAGETAAKLFHFWAGVIAAGMIYIAGKRLDSRLTGAVAATIFYTTPIVAWESTTAYIDLFQAMFIGGAMVMVLIWLYAQRTWAVAAGTGLYLGLAFGIRPTAGYVAISVGLIMLYAMWRDRSDRDWSDFWSVVAATLFTALLGGIWYLRSYLLTGNPVFPFLNGIFHSPMWYPRNETFNYSLFGIGTTPSSLFSLPWVLTYGTQRFGEVITGALGVMYLSFIPLSLLVLRRSRRLGPIVFITLVFGFFWFFSVQYLRYLISALVVLAVMSAWALIVVWRKLQERLPRLAWILPSFFVAFTLLNIPLTLIQYRYSIPGLVPYQVVFGKISREDYLAQQIPSYGAYTYLNTHSRKPDRVYAVGDYYGYFSNGEVLSPFWSVRGFQILAARDQTSLRQALGEAHISYVLINRPQVRATHWTFPIHDEIFLKRNAVLEYASKGVYLYRLISESSQTPAQEEKNLLSNAGFEEINLSGEPEGWIVIGHPVIDRIGKQAHSGIVAVLVNSQTGFFQRVAVKPEKMYALSLWTRSDLPNQTARLQIDWLDNDLKIQEVSVEVVPVTASWQWHDMVMIAPKGAALAHVYVSVDGTSQVWFDDYSFAERSK